MKEFDDAIAEFKKNRPPRKLRGFKFVSKYLTGNDAPLLLPKRATAYSAGYDFFNNGEDIVIEPNEIVKISTKVKSYMQTGEVLELYPRSSLGFKYNVCLVNTVGIVDADYYDNENNEGEIFAKLHNRGNKIVVIKTGEAYMQGIFKSYLLADNDEANGVRKGGIGSTDKLTEE